MSTPRIPYGQERNPWSGVTCHDCGVARGEIHSNGCDVEECETCGNQRIGCSCCVVCRAHENKGTWCVCAECIELARDARQEPDSLIDSLDLTALDRLLTAAQDEVSRICQERWNGGHGWRTSIPARSDYDSDIIITNALSKARAAMAGLVEAALASKTDPGFAP